MTVFNLQGSEIIFILLLALVVLGPEKLPSAIRRFTQTYAELRKMGTGFQTELRSALDEPMREMRETADLITKNADPSRIADDAERVVAESDRETADDDRFDDAAAFPDDAAASPDDAELSDRDAERKERAKQVIARRREQRFSFDLPAEVNGATEASDVDTGATDADADTATPAADSSATPTAESAPRTPPGDGAAEVAAPVSEPVDEWADPVDEESSA